MSAQLREAARTVREAIDVLESCVVEARRRGEAWSTIAAAIAPEGRALSDRLPGGRSETSVRSFYSWRAP